MKKPVATFLLLLPVCLSLLTLAAHFLRAGQLMPTAICIFLLFFLFMYTPLSARLVQLALVLGTIEWISTAVAFSAQRAAIGEPAGRMQAILGSVAAVSFLSIFVFYSSILKRRFKITPPDGDADTADPGREEPEATDLYGAEEHRRP